MLRLFSFLGLFFLLTVSVFSQGEPVSASRKSASELMSINAVEKLSENIDLTRIQKEDLVYLLAEYLDQLKFSDKSEKESLQKTRNRSARKILKDDAKTELFEQQIDSFLFPQKNYRR